MKILRSIFAAALALGIIAMFSACGNDGTGYGGTEIGGIEADGVTQAAAHGETAASADFGKLNLPTIPNKENTAVTTPWKTGDKYPVATITIGAAGGFKGGVVKAELYPDKAPNTVNNFISLAKSNYFSGRVFHRAVQGFMIQGGSPNGDGLSTGFPYSIKGEFSGNGFAQNDLIHTAGVLSMARTGIPDSGGCQFFIMDGDASWLDGQYAGFGKVTEGLDIVHAIAAMPVTGPQNDQLVNMPAIVSVTVDTFGVEYPAPVAIPAQ